MSVWGEEKEKEKEIRKISVLKNKNCVVLRIPKSEWSRVGQPRYYRLYVVEGKIVIEPVR